MSPLSVPRRPANGRPVIGRDIARRPPAVDSMQAARKRRPLPATPVPITRPARPVRVGTAAMPAPRPAPVPEPVRPPKASAVKRSKLTFLPFLQYPLIAGLALAAAYSSTLGQVFVLVYAVLALVTRRSSRLSFGAALFLLVTIPLFQALNQPGIAQNAAIYVYELLVVGTVQAIIELRKTDKTHSSSEI